MTWFGDYVSAFSPKDTNWTERRSPNKLDRPGSGYRDDYVRDRARVIHSAAFRRLQAKTQVLGIGEGDFHRTRLTHSMEVAQVARGIVRHVQEKGKSHRPGWFDWLPNPNLIETISLAHDLGHPPFGHGGEVALNFVMRNHGGFEGNGQTIRLLTLLEAHTEDYGLDLTRRTMLGVLKYPVPYETVLRRKPADVTTITKLRANDWKPPKCYLSSEQATVDWMLAPFCEHDQEQFLTLAKYPTDAEHGKSKQHSFDTGFMELGDDIAYGVHDFEDAVALRLVVRNDWMEIVDGLDEQWARNVELWPVSDIAADLFGDSSHKRKRAIGALVNAFIISAGVVENPGFNHPLLRFHVTLSDPARAFLNKLQELIKRRVIRTPQVQTLEYRGQQLIARLFDVIDSDPTRFLKEGFRREYEEVESTTAKKRILCDYIAGMTDEYATRIYERLFVPRQGHVFDRL